MGAPVAPAELVADQSVAGLVVGNAQQCLGETHQRDPLRAGERIFAHQRLDAGRPVFRTQPRHPFFSQAPRRRFLLLRHCGLVQKRRDAFRFQPPVSLGDRTPRPGLANGLPQKSTERTVLHGSEIISAPRGFKQKRKGPGSLPFLVSKWPLFGKSGAKTFLTLGLGLYTRRVFTVPTPAISPSSRSPRTTAATPSGVPVRMRSPGASATSFDSVAMMSGTGQI